MESKHCNQHLRYAKIERDIFLGLFILFFVTNLVTIIFFKRASLRRLYDRVAHRYTGGDQSDPLMDS
ncbi:unnamed protein product [Caenorhabditis auriculariae]|uniref:Uncharacterized protein n=1 Tax=Caenorhabditis auriculariae TaxID=2777116 RepID=A0A8S1GVG7_9PELO|nr:unnamed protein product [Caenorhabditis auriculariae]